MARLRNANWFLNGCLAFFLTGTVLAAQHLITDHVLSAVHLNTLQHLVYFAIMGSFMLPAALFAVMGAHWLVLRMGSDYWTIGDLVQRAAVTSLLFGLGVAAVSAGLNLAHPLLETLGMHGHAHAPLREALLAAALSLPLMVVGLAAAAVAGGHAGTLRTSVPVPTLSLRGVSVIVVTSMLISLVPVTYESGVIIPATTQAAGNSCTSGGPQRTYNVSAIFVRITLNHFGDNDPAGFMYVLDRKYPAAAPAGSSAPDVNRPGQRPDPAACDSRQPGRLRDDQLHQPVDQRAGLVSCAGPGLYRRQCRRHGRQQPQHLCRRHGGILPIASPCRPATAEGAFYFYSHGVSRNLVNHGLFGALVAEPAGSQLSERRDGPPLKSGWQAIIDTPTGPNFREFTLLLHEIGDEKSEIFDRNGGKSAHAGQQGHRRLPPRLACHQLSQ